MMEVGNFEWALTAVKRGKKVTRIAFKDTCYIIGQFPDANSANTKPYLVMVKGVDRFPVDLSCESIFADDWFEKTGK